MRIHLGRPDGAVGGSASVKFAYPGQACKHVKAQLRLGTLRLKPVEVDPHLRVGREPPGRN